MDLKDKRARIGVQGIKSDGILPLNKWPVFFTELPKHSISNLSWPEFNTACKASFSICHSNDAVLIQYHIQDDFFKSEDRAINDPVHKDNCVEFFIQFPEDSNYYNIEFNCLGIGKMAYGASRTHRMLLPKQTIGEIATWKKLYFSNEQFNWQIALRIPIEVFCYSDINALKGLTCKGNFYKCGDDLPAPHFLSWTKVNTQEPDFHMPEFFGEFTFE
ncbi:carbohydrate-binding family 9-like protein [Pedobacter sp.]|uniref:carbohydrate-binding family 9-like protein n=1 Tax=Pedobacter sp. TaxID=1411316 RepID=UPI003D7FE03F